MEQIILIAHVLIALAIIGLIMIQQGKGADAGASFGAGASQTLFGSAGGGNMLTSSTSWLVALFFATSFGLAIIAKNHSLSVGDIDIGVPVVTEMAAPLPVVDDAEVPAYDGQAPASGSDSDVPDL
ncbi:MAG: preprotein translocase subunit SecG [Spongiibacteraceae bacterium]